MNKVIFVVAIVLGLVGCSSSPRDLAYSKIISIACSTGNGDAFTDFTKKTVNLDYYPKEELKMFTFDGYTPSNEEEKEGMKQLFKLSARGCYLEAIKKQTPGSQK